MSLWIPRRDAEGRLYFYTINIPFLLVVAIPAICFAVLINIATTSQLESLVLSASMLFIGFAFFLSAKISVYHTGFWLSFGSDRMTARMRYLYRFGYLLMIPGALMTFLLSVFVIRIHG